jgi:hypothetical protein
MIKFSPLPEPIYHAAAANGYAPFEASKDAFYGPFKRFRERLGGYAIELTTAAIARFSGWFSENWRYKVWLGDEAPPAPLKQIARVYKTQEKDLRSFLKDLETDLPTMTHKYLDHLYKDPVDYIASLAVNAVSAIVHKTTTEKGEG